jgi:FKBP-type peptidyl-prolyl cis-trans isomerase FkpA
LLNFTGNPEEPKILIKYSAQLITQRFTVKNVISIFTAIIIAFTMFSIANANTPEENKKAGMEFLAKNAKNHKVITTKSGLQYEVLTEGKGISPGATDKVKVQYKGSLLDGTVFDSTDQHGGSVTFPLDHVIKGWTEGVQLMKKGATYRFYIPSELAYGEQGAGRVIGPNQTLIFDITLEDVIR